MMIVMMIALIVTQFKMLLISHYLSALLINSDYIVVTKSPTENQDKVVIETLIAMKKADSKERCKVNEFLLGGKKKEI